MTFSIQNTTVNESVNESHVDNGVQYFSNAGDVTLYTPQSNMFVTNTTGSVYNLYLQPGFLGQNVWITFDTNSNANVHVYYNPSNYDNYSAGSITLYTYNNNGWRNQW